MFAVIKKSHLEKIIQQEIESHFTGGNIQDIIHKEIEQNIRRKFFKQEIEARIGAQLRRSADSLFRKKIFTKEMRDKYFVSSKFSK